jgi:branched-chain amino acid transport system substrate-binding protein
VQGYDAAQMLAAGLNGGEGRLQQADRVQGHARRPRSTARAASSRCRKAHNPVQDIYLREVKGKENKVIGVAVKALADPARGCKM